MCSGPKSYLGFLFLVTFEAIFGSNNILKPISIWNTSFSTMLINHLINTNLSTYVCHFWDFFYIFGSNIT